MQWYMWWLNMMHSWRWGRTFVVGWDRCANGGFFCKLGALLFVWRLLSKLRGKICSYCYPSPWESFSWGVWRWSPLAGTAGCKESFTQTNRQPIFVSEFHERSDQRCSGGGNWFDSMYIQSCLVGSLGWAGRAGQDNWPLSIPDLGHDQMPSPWPLIDSAIVKKRKLVRRLVGISLPWSLLSRPLILFFMLVAM